MKIHTKHDIKTIFQCCLVLDIFYPCDDMLAWYELRHVSRVSVCLSLSVTSQCSAKTSGCIELKLALRHPLTYPTPGPKKL